MTFPAAVAGWPDAGRSRGGSGPRHGRDDPRGGPRGQPAAVTELLRQARHGLAEAATAPTPAERYATAHLAALRVAAGVLAARARPTSGRGRRGPPRSAWALLGDLAPELREWAAYFAAGARKRAAAEARLPRCVTPREADDVVRDAETFLGLVEAMLGAGHQPVLRDSGGGDPARPG